MVGIAVAMMVPSTLARKRLSITPMVIIVNRFLLKITSSENGLAGLNDQSQFLGQLSDYNRKADKLEIINKEKTIRLDGLKGGR
jgi:hypothetical protein